MSARLSALLLLMALPGIATADPDIRVSPIDLTPDSETLDEGVRISGAFVVGVVFDGADVLDQRPSLRAYAPRSLAGETVCMRASSLDGVYKAEFNYELPDPASWTGTGVVDFGYETRFHDFVADATPQNFAVSLSVGDCAGDPDTYLVSYWNALDGDGRLPVRLLINSLGAQEAYLFVGDDPSAPSIDCTSLRDGHSATAKKSFDFVCIIPPDAFDGAETVIEINTLTSGVADPARFVDLMLPTGH